jgi:hypothetical protein
MGLVVRPSAKELSMGVCIAPCFDQDIPGAEFDGDGKTLADCAQVLDDIAKAQGLSPAFSSFVSDPDTVAEKLPDGAMIEETWYDSRDGLRVVAGLVAALEAPDGRLRKRIDRRGGVLTPLWRAMGIKSGMEGKWAEFLLADLKELQRCLQLAVEKGARFYLFTY